MAELAHRREEAQAQILGADTLEELQEQLLVLGPHRTHEDVASVPEREAALPLLRIGPHRKARMALAAPGCRLRRDTHPRIDGDDAVLVGEERVDVELADLRHVGGKLRKLDQHEPDRRARRPPARRDRP